MHRALNPKNDASLTCLWLCVVLVASTLAAHSQTVLSTRQKPAAPKTQLEKFGNTRPSPDVQQMIDWTLHTQDNHNLPFVTVDKKNAQVFVFSSNGRLLGSAPVLLGFAIGDDGVPGIGDRPLTHIQPQERITPAGRFMANLGRNVSGQDLLWVSYEQSISLHPIRSLDPSERRLQRLISPSIADNRISYGCINVPTAFWKNVVAPTFHNTQGVVYVLPEERSLISVFGLTSLDKTATP